MLRTRTVLGPPGGIDPTPVPDCGGPFAGVEPPSVGPGEQPPGGHESVSAADSAVACAAALCVTNAELQSAVMSIVSVTSEHEG